MNPPAHNSPCRLTANSSRVEIEFIPAAVSAARVAQARWAVTPLATRLALIRELRHLIAQHSAALSEAGRAAIKARPDKVLFTGSAETGEKILQQLAPHLIPATMELSGSDAASTNDRT